MSRARTAAAAVIADSELLVVDYDDKTRYCTNSKTHG